MRTIVFCLFVLGVISTSQFTYAAQTAGSASAAATLNTDFDYPELNVTPRASDRLDQEARGENGRRWSRHFPIFASGLMTFTAGVLQSSGIDTSKDFEKTSKMAGLVVGGTWMAIAAGLSAYYNPYTAAQQDMSNMPKKSIREQLTRERFAEARIAGAASLACKLRWMSIITNFAASGYMISKTQSSSFSQVADGVAMAGALAPLIFRSYWIDVAEEQREYKKKIYAPVAGTTLTPEPMTGTPSPTFFLSFFF